MATAKPRLSDRDVAVLAALVRFGALRTDQVARRFFPSTRAARERLARLVAAGQVRRGPLDTFTATERGTRSSGVDLTPPNVWPGQLVHQLAVVDLAGWLLEHEPGSEWVTERELRREAAQLARAAGGGHRFPGTDHMPDGLLVTPARRIAIELELTAKPRSEYDRICRWYAQAIEFDAVRWYVRGLALEDRIRTFVERHDLADCMSVEQLPEAVRIVRWTA